MLNPDKAPPPDAPLFLLHDELPPQLPLVEQTEGLEC